MGLAEDLGRMARITQEQRTEAYQAGDATGINYFKLRRLIAAVEAEIAVLEKWGHPNDAKTVENLRAAVEAFSPC